MKQVNAIMSKITLVKFTGGDNLSKRIQESKVKNTFDSNSGGVVLTEKGKYEPPQFAGRAVVRSYNFFQQHY